ncbi:acyl-CoA thioesterase, partial [Mesorhizobium sp. M7A.F.Ca.US.001.02.1.1]
MEVQAAIEENLSGAVAGTLFRCPQATTGVVVLG